VCVKLLNYKIINIIHICVFYVNNKNVLQIYLYNINIYFGLDLSGSKYALIIFISYSLFIKKGKPFIKHQPIWGGLRWHLLVSD